MPTVSFRVVYPTTWGQTVAVLGAPATLGGGNPARAPRLTARVLGGQVVWQATLTLHAGEDSDLTTLIYRYAVLNADGVTVVDAEPRDRAVALPPAGDALLCRDTWTSDADPGALLTRAPFRIWRPARRCVSGGVVALPPPTDDPTAVTLHLSVRVAGLAPGDAVVVLGSAPALGAWRPERALALTETDTPLWRGVAVVPAPHFPVTYRYAVRRAAAAPDTEPDLEAGDNRIAAWEEGGAPRALASDGGWLRTASPWRGAGLAVPLFSVRSDGGCGAGSFGDIAPLATWCARAGLRVLQLLPVVDTRVAGDWTDSYPYSAVSAFALHPLYMDVDGLVEECGRSGVKLPPVAAQAYQSARSTLNPLPDVDYPATLAAKLAAAVALYYDGGGEGRAMQEEEEAAAASRGGDTGGALPCSDPPFAAWQRHHAAWLRPYLAHRVLADAVFGHARHAEWGALSAPTHSDVDRILASPLSRPARFEAWLQWHLWRQLKAAAAAAAGVGVALKGDLPIGVDPSSADAWWSAPLFRRHASTGAPPDAFDARGQAWGFPPYAWGSGDAGAMAAWWRARLTHMASFFALLRVDHVLGFFRVWELPAGAATGLCGQFRPAAAITRAELEAAGLWDVHRLADPYITLESATTALASVGGAAAVARFTVAGEGGRLRLAPVCASEALIDALTPADVAGLIPDAADTDALLAAAQAALLTLAQNVCLVRDLDAPSETFHPRFNVTASPSFASLPDPHWRDTLAAWHDDYYYGARHDALWTARARARRSGPSFQRLPCSSVVKTWAWCPAACRQPWQRTVCWGCACSACRTRRVVGVGVAAAVVGVGQTPPLPPSLGTQPAIRCCRWRRPPPTTAPRCGRGGRRMAGGGRGTGERCCTAPAPHPPPAPRPSPPPSSPTTPAPPPCWPCSLCRMCWRCRRVPRRGTQRRKLSMIPPCAATTGGTGAKCLCRRWPRMAS